MGNSSTNTEFYTYEKIQQYISENALPNRVLINTLDDKSQTLLIEKTLSQEKEVEIINHYIDNPKNIEIIIYGKSANDMSVLKKKNQLLNLGFIHVYIYPGGLFEWVLLREIFGNVNFPIINNEEIDLLPMMNSSLFK
jgi:rhodanese-related sulfurtransferase